MEPIDAAVPGYDFAAAHILRSPVSLRELEELKITVGFSAEVERYLKMAGGVLEAQTRQIVEHWRSGIIAGIPHLARHSRSPDGKALPDYLARSNRRFERWILDSCLRPYDQDWLNYQQEIALRHTTTRKNRTDGVESTAYIPLRDVIGFAAVMNETIWPPEVTRPRTSTACIEHGASRCSCSSVYGRGPTWTTSRPPSPSGKASNLSDAAVDEQFDAVDVAAVIGSEKKSGARDLFG
jgi:hypothetical protein